MLNFDFNKQEWLEITKCPLCGSEKVYVHGIVPGSSYTFGSEYIPFPNKKIKIFSCLKCSLVYKDIIPHPDFLSRIYSRQVYNKWPDKYNFSTEIEVINNLTNKEMFDLLDIGASKGSLLKACIGGGRRSALDIIKNDDLEKNVSGEIIEGFLEDRKLVWSNKPYDIVTLFDVLEHLYDPIAAFKNIKKILKKGGFVIIETGDVTSYFPQKYGVTNWNYTNLPEHNIFWSRKSLEYAAHRFGFNIIDFIQKKHKGTLQLPILIKMRRITKRAFYMISPTTYKFLYCILGKNFMQPQFSFKDNHFRATLLYK